MSWRIFILLFLFIGCDNSEDHGSAGTKAEAKISWSFDHQGTLFVIGGGSRPNKMVKEMLRRAELSPNEPLFVIPYASISPDTAFHYAKEDFLEAGHRNVALLDSVQLVSNTVREAKLIYMTGGDQNRLMRVLSRNNLKQALSDAFRNGALIAGTSAGAAVMSGVMISGDQKNMEEYEPTYSRLELGNGIYGEGLGLIDGVVVDQHFVERSRYNRLVSALADHPGKWGIGIGESTAAIFSKSGLEVSGDGQVVVIHPIDYSGLQEELLSVRGIKMDILKGGEKWDLE